MGSGADVRDIEILREFAVVLQQFADEGETALRAYERLIDRTRRWLNEEIRERSAAVERRGGEVAAARMALESCHGRQEDCTEAERAYEEAARREDRAKERLRRARRARREFLEEVEEFRDVAREFHYLVREGTDEATRFLRERSEELDEYLGTASGGGAVTGGSGRSRRGGVAGWRFGTALSGFDAESLPLDEDEVTRFLNLLPKEHMRHVARVEYVDEYKRDEEGGGILGWNKPWVEGLSRIQIFREHPDGWENSWNCFDTLAHEIGHEVWRHGMDTSMRAQWEDLHEARRVREKDAGRFVTPYARKDSREDFCESYAVYPR